MNTGLRPDIYDIWITGLALSIKTWTYCQILTDIKSGVTPSSSEINGLLYLGNLNTPVNIAASMGADPIKCHNILSWFSVISKCILYLCNSVRYSVILVTKWGVMFGCRVKPVLKDPCDERPSHCFKAT